MAKGSGSGAGAGGGCASWPGMGLPCFCASMIARAIASYSGVPGFGRGMLGIQRGDCGGAGGTYAVGAGGSGTGAGLGCTQGGSAKTGSGSAARAWASTDGVVTGACQGGGSIVIGSVEAGVSPRVGDGSGPPNRVCSSSRTSGGGATAWGSTWVDSAATGVGVATGFAGRTGSSGRSARMEERSNSGAASSDDS